MDINTFFYEFFIKPIYDRSGYNLVNTTVYAFLALLSVYIVYKWWKLKNIKFNNHFLISLFPYILFGSSKRVVTDVVDAFKLEGLWKFYDYNIINVSPGIYITIGFLFIIFYYLEKIEKLPKWSSFFIGSLLAIFHIALLIPFIKNVDFIFNILTLAFIGGILAFFIGGKRGFLAGFSQGLDGAATYYAIEFLDYSEQHVIPSFIGERFGYVWFYIIKLIFTILFVFLLENEEKDEDKKILAYVIIIIAGFAPGFRDLLRIITGV